VWYPADAEEVAGPVIQAFQKPYPGITVQHTNERQQTMFSQIHVPQAAKDVTIDVASAANDVADRLGIHMAASVDWAKLGVPPDRVLQDVVEVGGNSAVTIFVTQKVAAADVPKSWDDLLDPRWQGKLPVDGRASWMPMYLAAPELGGKDKGLEYARKNNPPIDIASVSPVYRATTFACVPAGAPQMAAAQLLVSWLGLADGQAALSAAETGSRGSCDAPQQPPTTPRCAAGTSDT
jgi:ABC-type Fe3+ transport system substrate-binding protein